jgi:hypothetical protein
VTLQQELSAAPTVRHKRCPHCNDDPAGGALVCLRCGLPMFDLDRSDVILSLPLTFDQARLQHGRLEFRSRSRSTHAGGLRSLVLTFVLATLMTLVAFAASGVIHQRNLVWATLPVVGGTAIWFFVRSGDRQSRFVVLDPAHKIARLEWLDGDETPTEESWPLSEVAMQIVEKSEGYSPGHVRSRLEAWLISGSRRIKVGESSLGGTDETAEGSAAVWELLAITNAVVHGDRGVSGLPEEAGQ